MYDLKQKYNKEVLPKLISDLGYKSSMDAPKISKVVVNIGTGSVKEKEEVKRRQKDLAIITGQALSPCPARKSIASFKLRQGNIVGYSVTLRGKRMYDFLNKMVFVAIPRKRDFRGLNEKSVDECGNLTIGFPNHLVFPEMAGEDVQSAFGLSVVIVSTAQGRKKGLEFFKEMGIPFKKEKPKPNRKKSV